MYVFIKKLLLSFSGKMLLLYTKADTVSLYGFIFCHFLASFHANPS